MRLNVYTYIRIKAFDKEFLRSMSDRLLEPRTRVVDGVTVLPYREFLDALWGGRYRENGVASDGNGGIAKM